MYEGTLKNLLTLDPVFPTTVPAIHGLHFLENNMAEGFVIKPYRNYFLPCGSRVVLKLKNPKFCERQPKKSAEKPATEQDGVIAIAVDIAVRCVTQNRLDNVRSKFVDPKRSDLISGMNTDILDEVQKSHPLTPTQVKDVRRAIQSHILALI